jgi:hypothetical protein
MSRLIGSRVVVLRDRVDEPIFDVRLDLDAGMARHEHRQ